MLSMETRGKPKFLDESCKLLRVSWLFHPIASPFQAREPTFYRLWPYLFDSHQYRCSQRISFIAIGRSHGHGHARFYHRVTLSQISVSHSRTLQFSSPPSSFRSCTAHVSLTIVSYGTPVSDTASRRTILLRLGIYSRGLLPSDCSHHLLSLQSSVGQTTPSRTLPYFWRPVSVS
jgi:hypothetical protein